MICEHPECNGRHGHDRPASEKCPAVAERRRQYNRQDYEAHRKERQEYGRQYYQAHRKERQEYVHQYYLDHPEQTRERKRRWRADPNNRPKIFAYQANKALRRIEKRIAEA